MISEHKLRDRPDRLRIVGLQFVDSLDLALCVLGANLLIVSLAPRVGASPISRQAGGDRKQPRREPMRTSIAPDLLPGTQKCLLRQIFSIGAGRRAAEQKV